MAYEGANAFGMSSIKIFINESLTERERGGGEGECSCQSALKNLRPGSCLLIHFLTCPFGSNLSPLTKSPSNFRDGRRNKTSGRVSFPSLPHFCLFVCTHVELH